MHEDVVHLIERFEATNHQLIATNKNWRRICLALLVAILAVAVFPRSSRLSAQDKPGKLIVPPDSSVDVSTVGADMFLIRDSKNQNKMMISCFDRAPYISLFGDKEARLIVQVDDSGEPSLVFYDKNGENPFQLVVTRDKEKAPRLELRPYTPPPAKPVPDDPGRNP